MDFSELLSKKVNSLEDQEKTLSEELLHLQAEETKLRDKIEQAKKKLYEAAQERRKSQPLTISVESLAGNSINIKCSDIRDDLLNILRNTPGRYYDYGTNHIPIKEWNTFLSKLSEIKNIEVKYLDGIKGSIQAELDKPRAKIFLSEDKRKIIIEVLKGEDWLARRIYGIQRSGNHYQIGIAEAWQVSKVLSKEPSIEWSDEVLTEISRVEEKQTLIDQIATSGDIELDDLVIPIELRPFQRVGIKFAELSNYRLIYGDEMGLGKTIEAIACQLRIKKKEGKCKTLVVCPANLRVNWTREIVRLTGQSPQVLFGREPDKFQLSKLFKQEHEWVIINYDILGSRKEYSKIIDTPHSQLRTEVQDVYSWVEILNILNFDLVIFDEAHYAKNTESNRSIATRKMNPRRVIFMTGTPVLNKPGELWPMLTVIDHERFPSYENFLWTYTVDGKQPRNVEQLRQTLKNVMIRRRKKDVIKELPPINRIYEWHELSGDARVRYNKAKQGVYLALKEWEPNQVGSEKKITSILAEIMRLKQICAADKIETVSDMAIEMSDSDEGSGKVLIFSQFRAVVEEIGKRLTEQAVVYHGEVSADERTRIYDRFLKDEKLKFFIATWQTAGEGLNLQCANNVIFADLFWTPANHMQCEGRAYGRLADPHPINSYYVVCEDTIEDWIQELLAQKLAIIEATVEGLDSERNESIANSLLRRMKKELG